MTWKHNQLQADLAAHLRGIGRVVWEDMQLGPAGSPRPDCYSIPRSFARFQPLAYEIKISRSDFRSDVTSGKWQAYTRFAVGVIFAVPAGMIKRDEVPPGCGLIVRSDAGWRSVKKPTLAKLDNLPRSAWVKLLIDGVERLRAEPRTRVAHQYAAQKAIRKRYGDDVAAALSSRDAAVDRLEYETERLEVAVSTVEADRKRIVDQATEAARSDADALRKEMADTAAYLGMSEASTLYQVIRALRELRASTDANIEIQRLRRQIREIYIAADNAVKTFA